MKERFNVQFRFNEGDFSLFFNTRLFAIFCYVWAACVCLACQTKVQEISLSDKRLPAEARQKIADAQDAQIVARAKVANAENQLRQAQEKQAKSLKQSLGSANQQFQQLAFSRIHLADIQLKMSQAELDFTRKRLSLVYAQTAMRYDLAVYDVTQLEMEVEELKKRYLSLRGEFQTSKNEWEKRLTEWWSAYGQLGQNTQAYWSFE
jgi:hypothetical protein